MQWLHWALLSAAFAAATAVFAKLGLRGLDPDVLTLLRSVLIVVFIGAFVLAVHRGNVLVALDGRTWTFLILSAAAAAASWICYFRALAVGDATRVATIDRTSILITAIFAVWLLGERPSSKEWVGMALVAAGGILMVMRR